MKRYSVHHIDTNSNEGKTVLMVARGPQSHTDDANWAKELASSDACESYYGTAIIDHVAGTVDLGDRVISMNECEIGLTTFTVASRIDQIASSDLVEAIAASNLDPATAASLRAEEVNSQEEADARIREVLADVANGD